MFLIVGSIKTSLAKAGPVCLIASDVGSVAAKKLIM